MTRKAWLGVAVLAALLTVGGLAAPPVAHSELGPHGTLALQRFLRNMGERVRQDETPPSPGSGTFVLLDDLRDAPSARKIVAWVRSGGRLILADPSSRIKGQLGGGPVTEMTGLFGSRRLRPECPELQEGRVKALEVAASDSVFTRRTAGALQCFPADEGHFLEELKAGRGTVTLLGGRSPFTNEFLSKPDNATFAYRLFGGSGPVVFGPALPASAFGEPQGPWKALPSPAKSVLIELALAAVLFAAVKGRRFGRPVDWSPVSPIPSSRLVWATASLFRNSKAAGFSGRILREAALSRISRTGSSSPAADGAMIDDIAVRASLDHERAARVLAGPEPADDAQLIQLGRELEELESALKGGFR